MCHLKKQKTLCIAKLCTETYNRLHKSLSKCIRMASNECRAFNIWFPIKYNPEKRNTFVLFTFITEIWGSNIYFFKQTFFQNN